MTIVHTKALLRERLGLSFEGHAEERLRRAVADQMGALAIASETAYLARLRSDESALHALTALVTVKETYFYREPHHLRLLVERLGPELLRGRSPGHPVRILSAGCATGEEPYSIAIALREAWGEDAERLFRIEACDVDRSALRQALNGRYRPLAFRAMPQELIDRWFAPHRNGERTLAEPIRRAVAFRPLSLLAAPYPADLAGQDLIFYRNLSIYFDRETRQAVLTRLRALLRPGGYLIVGTAETLANDLGHLTLCERDGIWLFANRPPEPIPAPAAEAKRPLRSAALPLPPPPSVADEAGARAERDDDRLYRQALALARAERIDAALRLLAPLCAPTGAAAAPLALQARLLLERGDREGAHIAAHRVLALDPWSTDALVLVGRIARARGALDQAIDALRRAVYQSPERWPAHYQLAECYRATGENALALREYRIARRLLERPEAAHQDGPLPSPLALQDLRRLCEARLASLRGTA